MAELNCPKEFRQKVLESVQNYQFHSEPEGCFISTPFLDASGDNLLVRVRKSDGGYVVDDGGYISHMTEYVQPTSRSIRRVNEILRDTPSIFGMSLNRDEGTIYMRCPDNEIGGAVLKVIQAVIALDGSLSHVAVESTKDQSRSRTSLGPRVATKIVNSIKPILNQNLAQRNVIVNGQAVEDWKVDLRYQPKILTDMDKIRHPSITSVVVIAVDLAIKEPIHKASEAMARAIDIKGAHEDYEIRVALDTHQQNGTVLAAKGLLEKHQDNKFRVFDLGKPGYLAQFTNQIHLEVGAL